MNVVWRLPTRLRTQCDMMDAVGRKWLAAGGDESAVDVEGWQWLCYDEDYAVSAYQRDGTRG
jgi:hypothetical protein